jgi:DNA-binding CsgD family transcriptional regulator
VDNFPPSFTEDVQSIPHQPFPALSYPDIHWFDEGDLLAVNGQDPCGTDTHIATELSMASGAEENARLVRTMLRLIGFDSMRYSTLRFGPTGDIERIYLLRNGVDRPGSGYLQEERYRYDPRYAAVMASRAPYRWDLPQLTRAWRAAGAADPFRDSLCRLDAAGVRSGLVFAIRTSRSDLCSVVSLSSDQPNRGWISDSHIAQALALGLSIHQRCSGYVRSRETDPALSGLSPTQTRILSLLCAGMADKEIAHRLQTTPHTVDYHLRRLRERFGASNRSQLVFRAARSKLA